MPIITAVRELRYAGRTIVPGESFDASEKDAKLLVAIGKARAAAGEAPRVPKTEEDIVALRGDYETMVGKRPFMGWSAETIRDKMESYRRRSLKASDYETTALQAED